LVIGSTNAIESLEREGAEKTHWAATVIGNRGVGRTSKGVKLTRGGTLRAARGQRKREGGRKIPQYQKKLKGGKQNVPASNLKPRLKKVAGREGYLVAGGRRGRCGISRRKTLPARGSKERPSTTGERDIRLEGTTLRHALSVPHRTNPKNLVEEKRGG